ncbi:MAG: NAD-dependent succinate-semialdehyde dehydrogenase [Cryomorphaceae bacterium]|nr:NAD-dependent succinate-semialdehyde dehydrogenase [Cryomorphaceae bacterium]
MAFISINPFTEKENARFSYLNSEALDDSLEDAWKGFKVWRKLPLKERCRKIHRLANELEQNREAYAISITTEMGKPIFEARAEIDKCVWLARYYADMAPKFLEPKHIHTDSVASYVQYDPLGVVFGIMPWNYPFWQVLRFAVPTLLAGNSVLVKHAPSVPMCSLAIEEAFDNSGFPKHAFTQLFISEEQAKTVIESKQVRAISLTGSEAAGRSVAALAGAALKKCVLELGGSNALFLLPDGDVDLAVKLAIQGRFGNAGQSCIAAKRLIVPEAQKEVFIKKLIKEAQGFIYGNPLNEKTTIGPLARKDLAKTLDDQMKTSIQMGATLHLGGKRKGGFFEPTIIADVTPGMPAFDEETFGPLACVSSYGELKEGLKLAKQTKYGLGITLVTKDIPKARQMAKKFEDGAVFINQWVKSDPRLPFGGQKSSGYGRELAEEGIKEFVNIKTIRV